MIQKVRLSENLYMELSSNGVYLVKDDQRIFLTCYELSKLNEFDIILMNLLEQINTILNAMREG